MINRYYKISESSKAIQRALDAGLGPLIEAIEEQGMGNIQKITTTQKDNGEYIEIKIKLV